MCYVSTIVTVHDGLRVNVRPCPSTAFVQLHGDAETRMHPVGEYNELEPDSRGRWLVVSPCPLEHPLSSFLYTPPPPDPLSLFLRLSFSFCFVSHRCTLITSLSSRLILALFPCPIVYTPTVACSFKFRTSQPVTGVRPRLSSGTAPVTGIENVLTGVLERRLTFVPCYAAVFVLDFYGRVSRGKSREICASFIKERTR